MTSRDVHCSEHTGGPTCDPDLMMFSKPEESIWNMRKILHWMFFFSSMHHRQHRVFNCSVAASMKWWLHLKFKYCNFTLSSWWTRPSSDAPKTGEMARRKHPSEELSPRHAAVFRLETLMLFSVMQLQLCCRVNSRSPGRKESSELCNREEWRKMKKIPCQNRNVCMSSVVSILRCRLFSSFPRQGSDGLLRVVRAEEWERLIKGD